MKFSLLDLSCHNTLKTYQAIIVLNSSAVVRIAD